jgi:pyrroloquinoline quinone biosynthesis protein E
MHPELEQMVQLASAAGLVVNLTSSGTLLTAQGAQALKQSGLGQLQLSLNGSQAELHQRTRPGFEQVRRAMAFCRQARLRFGLNILVMRQNLSDLEAILALAQQEGAWSVNLLRPKAALDQPAETASAWLEQALPTADENRYLQGILKRWQRKARFLLQTDTSLTFLRQGKARAFVRSGLGGCSAGRRMLSIQVDGRVAPCSHIALTDELPLSGDFMQIWQSSRHLERFRQLEETLSGACGS